MTAQTPVRDNPRLLEREENRNGIRCIVLIYLPAHIVEVVEWKDGETREHASEYAEHRLLLSVGRHYLYDVEP